MSNIIITQRCRFGHVHVYEGERFEAEIKRKTNRGHYDGYAVIYVPEYGEATISPNKFEVVEDEPVRSCDLTLDDLMAVMPTQVEPGQHTGGWTAKQVAQGLRVKGHANEVKLGTVTNRVRSILDAEINEAMDEKRVSRVKGTYGSGAVYYHVRAGEALEALEAERREYVAAHDLIDNLNPAYRKKAQQLRARASNPVKLAELLRAVVECVVGITDPCDCSDDARSVLSGSGCHTCQTCGGEHVDSYLRGE